MRHDMFQKVILYLEIIIASWLIWPISILCIIIALLYVVLKGSASLENARQWERLGGSWGQYKAKQERSTYKLVRVLLIPVRCAYVVIVIFCLFKLVMILFEGNPTEKVFLVIFLGIGLLAWLESLIIVLKQSKLNRLILSLISNLQISNIQLISMGEQNNLIAEAREYLTSKSLHFRHFILPWKYIEEIIGMGRKLIAPFEHSENLLDRKQKVLLEGIRNSEMQLLSYKFIDQSNCRHRDKYYNNGDSPFTCLYSNASGNKIYSAFWCKYCLVSFSTVRHVPVIVKPPPR
jgi:hypothetical protein